MYHSSTQRRQQLQDWQEEWAKFAMMLSSTKRTP